MNIRENATVKVMSGLYAGMSGKVVKVYSGLNIALVSFDDVDVVGKVSLSSLDVVKPQEIAVEPKPEIPEGAKRISKVDFEAAIVQVVRPDKVMIDSDPMCSLSRLIAAKIVADSVRDQIFKDKDAVGMTEDEFIGALWNACNPVAVAKTTGNQMVARRAAHVGVSAYLTLEEIVEILYAGDND